MSQNKGDELKGRVKEAVGALADDDELKREGKEDQLAGKLKRKTDEVIDTVRDKLSGDDR